MVSRPRALTSSSIGQREQQSSGPDRGAFCRTNVARSAETCTPGSEGEIQKIVPRENLLVHSSLTRREDGLKSGKTNGKNQQQQNQ
jgi:hypothetical protein